MSSISSLLFQKHPLKILVYSEFCISLSFFKFLPPINSFVSLIFNQSSVSYFSCSKSVISFSSNKSAFPWEIIFSSLKVFQV